MHGVAAKYDCNRYIKYNHSVKSAVWSESKGHWQIQVDNQGKIVHDEVDVFINAGGVLKYDFPCNASCFADIQQ
jgi:cation diffusion facilitator CzcD-associated flavoprotein CzcO